jgi:hypothetical protein
MAEYHSRIYDPEWQTSVPRTRLQYLGDEPPALGPDNCQIEPGNVLDFVKALRLRAKQTIEPELLHDRQALWDNQPSEGEVRPCGTTDQAHGSFHAHIWDPPMRNRSWSWPTYFPGTPGPSGSASSWEVPGKGNGKDSDKGKGKHFHKGPSA